MSRYLVPILFSLVLCEACKSRSDPASSEKRSRDATSEEIRQNTVVILDQNQASASPADKECDAPPTEMEAKPEVSEGPEPDRHQVDPSDDQKLVYGIINRTKMKCESKPCSRYTFRFLNLAETPVALQSLVLPPELKKAKIESGKIILLGKLKMIRKKKKAVLAVKAGYAFTEGSPPNLHLIFAVLENQNPQRQCYVAPCPNRIANVLNTARSFLFDNLDTQKFSHLAQPDKILQNLIGSETIVMGESVLGKYPLPGGFEKTFRVEAFFQKIK